MAAVGGPRGCRGAGCAENAARRTQPRGPPAAAAGEAREQYERADMHRARGGSRHVSFVPERRRACVPGGKGAEFFEGSRGSRPGLPSRGAARRRAGRGARGAARGWGGSTRTAVSLLRCDMLRRCARRAAATALSGGWLIRANERQPAEFALKKDLIFNDFYRFASRLRNQSRRHPGGACCGTRAVGGKSFAAGQGRANTES